MIRDAFSDEQKAEQRKELLLCVDLFNKNKHVDAVKVLTELLNECEGTDDFCAVLSFLAISYTAAGDARRAVKLYRKALGYDGTRAAIWSSLGMLFCNMGYIEKAIESYEEAVKYESNAQSYNDLANAYYNCGMYDKAAQNARMALEKDEKLYQASALLCMIYHAEGNEEESERYFKIAVENGQDPSTLKYATQRIF